MTSAPPPFPIDRELVLVVQGVEWAAQISRCGYEQLLEMFKKSKGTELITVDTSAGPSVFRVSEIAAIFWRPITTEAEVHQREYEEAIIRLSKKDDSEPWKTT